MEKYGFVYIWYNKVRKMYYIGSHWGTIDDGYICSSNWMRNDYNRHKENFKRRILSRIYTNRQDTFLKEQEWLNLIKPEEIKTRYYNIRITTIEHWLMYPDKIKTIKEKISFTLTGKKHSEETKKKMSEAHKGHVVTQKCIDALIERNKKNRYPVSSGAFKKGIIPYNKGISPSKEECERLKMMANEYIWVRNETKNSKIHKDSPIPNGWWLGYINKPQIVSEETRNILREKNKNKRWINNGKEFKFINKEEVEVYMEKGWKKGRLLC